MIAAFHVDMVAFTWNLSWTRETLNGLHGKLTAEDVIIVPGCSSARFEQRSARIRGLIINGIITEGGIRGWRKGFAARQRWSGLDEVRMMAWNVSGSVGIVVTRLIDPKWSCLVMVWKCLEDVTEVETLSTAVRFC